MKKKYNLDKNDTPTIPSVHGGTELLNLFKLQNYPVVKRNDLIQNTRYRMTTSEEKFVLHMIQLVTNKTEELRPVTISFKQYARFLGLKPYRMTIHRIKRSLTKLNSKQFWLKKLVGGHRKEYLLMWFTSVVIDDSDETITVQFNPRLKPFLVKTKQFFTKYDYLYILTMKSSYSIRLYEYFVSYYSLQNSHKGFNYTLDMIRYHLDIQNMSSYKSYSNMRTRILEPAVKEINALTDMNIRIRPYKHGRRVVGINVLLKKKNKRSMIKTRNLVEKRLLNHVNNPK